MCLKQFSSLSIGIAVLHNVVQQKKTTEVDQYLNIETSLILASKWQCLNFSISKVLY